MSDHPNRRPELPPALDEQVSQTLRSAVEASRAGDTATASRLWNEAWDLLPGDKYGWDRYPETTAYSAVVRCGELGLCDQLPVWIERMYTGYNDPERETMMTLIAEGEGWLSCGREAEARLAFQRAFDLHGKRGFRGEWARYLDWLNGAPLEPEPVDEPSSMSPEELEELEEQIDEIAEAGNDRLEEHDDWQGAIEIWRRGLALLPASERYSETAMWFYASIGAAQRLGGETDDELESFELAYRSGDGFVNPFVLAGLGMALYDSGRPDDAVDYLLRAYMMSGDEIFEDEDPQYLDLLKSKGLI